MKILYPSLLFPIIYFIAFVTEIQSAYSQDSLRGFVRQVKEYSVTASGDSLLISQKYFDENQNLLEHLIYNNDGDVVKTLKNKFNKQNLKQKKESMPAMESCRERKSINTTTMGR